MIREAAASAAYWLGVFCLWRSRAWSWRSELMSDVATWLDTTDSWAEIRARRGGDQMRQLASSLKGTPFGDLIAARIDEIPL
ncbi:hypothetical protein [Bradyrhizobium japonicum]|uniref:hypothetical protein n=1 Tax=Bradyrhizobium japonicum TaxID=375 RepID=UPI000403CA5F|nr:hypothetical protein [Bradyrhizobium japonicum]